MSKFVFMDKLGYIIKKYNLVPGSSPMVITNLKRFDIPLLFNDLGFKSGAEVGIRRGPFSQRLCQCIPNLSLLCVDPWLQYKTSPQLPSQKTQDKNYRITKERLAPYNAKLIRKMSMDAVVDIPLESLDFVYIDGHHGYGYVRDDLREWSKRIRPGGIVSGDDYGADGVTRAVDEYILTNNISDWFLTGIDKGKSSYFWIKK